MCIRDRIYMNEGVRLIGVTASNLAPPLETVDLFSTVREKQVKAAAVMDAIQAVSYTHLDVYKRQSFTFASDDD